MVGPFCFVLHSWLAGIAGRNKLLINMKAHLQRCAFLLLLKDICKDVLFALPSFGLGLRAKVQGSRSGFAALFIGRCLKVVF